MLLEFVDGQVARAQRSVTVGSRTLRIQGQSSFGEAMEFDEVKRTTEIACHAMLLAFHKPYGVISQFKPAGSRYRTLSEFGFPKHVYPLGRLDAESEGLLLLSDEAKLNARLLQPHQKHRRVYWAQVERQPSSEALLNLERGIVIAERKTLPCCAQILDPQPQVTPREPPIRSRKNVPDVWIELELIEGKNHQVRRMTAAVGHPTLRLLRVQIGDFGMGNLEAGQWRKLGENERRQLFIRAQ